MAKPKINLKNCAENSKFKDAQEELTTCKGDCDSCPNDMRTCLQLVREKLAMVLGFVDEFQDGVAKMTIEVIRDKIDNPKPLKEMNFDDRGLFI